MFHPVPVGRRRRWVRMLFAACVAVEAATALARPIPEPAPAAPSGSPPTASVVQRGPVSLAQATAMALRRYKGRVARAETVMQGGRAVHVIVILGDDGRVRTVRIDAQTGAFL